MAQRNAEKHTRTQREKLLAAARDLGVSQSEAILRRALAKAARAEAKKAVRKPTKST
jgi:hypothetical protein